MSDPIRVILVEDEALYRDLVRIALSQDSELQVVGSFGDAETALAEAEALQPDVAILDIELGGPLNGIEVGLRLRSTLPRIGVVLLSGHRDPEFIASLPAEILAGWSYLLKQSVDDVDTLRRAIQGAAAGEVTLDPLLVSGIHPRSASRLARLSPRQRAILALIAQGLTNGAIAARLALSEKSIENQTNLIYQQLGVERRNGSVHPRVDAVLRYMQESRVSV